MRLATIRYRDIETVGILAKDGWVPLIEINRYTRDDWPTDMASLIGSGAIESLKHWYAIDKGRIITRLAETVVGFDEVAFAPLMRHPSKIWGIGLNYAEHAADLSEKAPTGIPGSFMKPDTTIIGHGDAIHLPAQSNHTTAEGELGIIIGKPCKQIDASDWLDNVAGFTTILDMTAEDILRQNPRYLTVSKSFDTFLSIGPVLVTPDEIQEVATLKVSTVHNGDVHAQNRVANMTFSPQFLITFLSEVMTLKPGDIISTGTPGAVVIKDGDVVECHISGFHPLKNRVVDLKND